MATIVKSLGNNTLTSASDANLYPSSGYATRSAVISRIRFVNTSDTTAATLLLKLKRSTSTPVVAQMAPGVVTIPPRALFILDGPITLEGPLANPATTGDAILATTTGGALDVVVSGVEKD